MQNTHEQLEIFSLKNNYSNNRVKKFGRIFARILEYEKVILFIIIFLVTSLVSFSLGVERGKRIGMRKTIDTSSIAVLKQEQKPLAQNGVVLPKTPEQPKKEVLMSGYTVQVASHKTKDAALREAQSLKKRGFPSFILSKGNYVIVCAGIFPSKEKAMVHLNELRKNYKDCFIRRL